MNVLRIASFEVRLVASDPWSIFWLLLMPIIMIYFFAKAFPQGGDATQATVHLEVCSEDEGFLAKALVEDLEEEGFITVHLESLEERRDRGWIRSLLIPEGFTDAVLRGEEVSLIFEVEKGSNATAEEAARVKIFKAVATILGNLCLVEADAAPSRREGEVVEDVYARVSALEPRVVLESSFAGKGRVIPGGYNQTVPGMIVMSVIFSVLTYGTALFAQDRRSGLLRRLVTTPCSSSVILSGKLLGRILMGFLQVAILLLVSSLAFGFYLGNSWLGWVVCIVPYTFACGALGMLLGCFFKSEDQAGTIGWIPAMLMAALGGCWWPREIVPDYLNYVGYLFPTAWAMDGLHKIISFGKDATAVLPEAGALCGFFVVFMLLCVKFFRHD